jgi:hypothetical protein
MKLQLPKTLRNYFLDFAKLYHRYRVEAEKLRSVRYQIVSSLADYRQTKKIELSITDRPGDILPPLSIEQIKKAPDIIPYMHPVDVNSINDLYYLSKDEIVEIRVSDNKIIDLSQEGLTTEYNINDKIDINQIDSTRVSYMIGYIQAEKLVHDAYKKNDRYKILKDNISTLHISDKKTNKEFLKKPTDILFSGEYKWYSKEDIAKIGYICGQLSQFSNS